MSTQTRSGTEQMQDIADGAQTAAAEVAQEARHQVDEVAGRAGGWLSREVDRRSTEVGEQMTTVAQDARSFSELLRNHEKALPSQVFQQVAKTGERAGSYLTNSNAEKIRNDAEDFGRRQPWLIGLSTIGLGFAAARLLRASDLERAKRREEALRAATTGMTGSPTPPVPPSPYAPPASSGAGVVPPPAPFPATDSAATTA